MNFWLPLYQFLSLVGCFFGYGYPMEVTKNSPRLLCKVRIILATCPTSPPTALPTQQQISQPTLTPTTPLCLLHVAYLTLRHIYSHKKNSMVTRPTRWHPWRRPHYYRQRNSKMKLDVDGLFFQTTISDSITNKLQTPLLPPQFRGIRHLIKNNETFASKELMRVIHAAVKAELGKVGITGLMKFSNEEWIVAPPLRNQRVRSSGIIHRDVPYKSSGYLTVIILLGKTSERGYGSINLWQNSHLLESGRTSHYPKNFKRDHLDKCGPATIDLKKNLIIFDSRLIHQSLPHSQDVQRNALSFYITIGNRQMPSPSINLIDLESLER